MNQRFRKTTLFKILCYFSAFFCERLLAFLFMKGKDGLKNQELSTDTTISNRLSIIGEITEAVPSSKNFYGFLRKAATTFIIINEIKVEIEKKFSNQRHFSINFAYFFADFCDETFHAA